MLETGLQNFHDGLLFRENLPLLAASLATFLATFLAELLFECHNGRIRNRIFLRGLGVLCGQNAFRANSSIPYRATGRQRRLRGLGSGRHRPEVG